MKLDINALRYISQEEWRVLTAVELGQRNHEIVPVPLIDSIAGLKHGGTYRCLKLLLRHKLLHHDNTKYDGFRLTYLGYDFLAIRALSAKGLVSAVGTQIGVGKESDIFEVINADGEVLVLKLHRLGRTSFRAVKSKRDYLKHRSSFSWLYLSRLAALKEFAFMKALGDRGFPTPRAVECNRHAVLMSLVDGGPMVQVKQLQHPGVVYRRCVGLAAQLASWGLVHCDFNEFNLLISDEEEVTCIDFPQMVSASHANAEELYERDVQCVIRFFKKKIGYMPELDPDNAGGRLYTPFKEAVAGSRGGADGGGGAVALDVELAASGFDTSHQKALEQAFAQQHALEGQEEEEGEEDGGEEVEEEEGEEATGSGSEVGFEQSGEQGEDQGEARTDGEEEAGTSSEEGERQEAGASSRVGKGGAVSGSGKADAAEGAADGRARSSATGGPSPLPPVPAPPTPQRQQQQQQPAAVAAAGGAGQYAADRATLERRKAAKKDAMARASRNAAKDKTRNNRRSKASAAMF